MWSILSPLLINPPLLFPVIDPKEDAKTAVIILLIMLLFYLSNQFPPSDPGEERRKEEREQFDKHKQI